MRYRLIQPSLTSENTAKMTMRLGITGPQTNSLTVTIGRFT